MIQLLMGWEDYHLWSFEIAGIEYQPPIPKDDLFMVSGPPPQSANKTTLDQAVGGRRIKFRYTYDFGDNWEIDIKVEKTLDPDPGVVYPRALAGAHAGPPEDCGGPWGYAQLLEVLADPTHEEHGQMLEWIGGEWNADAFDVDAVNTRLKRRTRKPRAKKT